VEARGKGEADKESSMRSAIIFATGLLTFAGSTFAQEYVEFKSQQDRFSIVFPA
jgi:hypothetical protein